MPTSSIHPNRQPHNQAVYQLYTNWDRQKKRITKVYGKVIKTHALRNIDLGFRQAEFSSIIGYSGSGKTTLLNILGALDRPTESSLLFQKKEVSAMNENQLATFRNKNIGFIFQFHHLLPEFSALENVLMPTWIEAGSGTKKKLNAPGNCWI